jgi:hypothetical protein
MVPRAQSRRTRNCARRGTPSHRWDPAIPGLLEALSDIDGLISNYLPAGHGVRILALVSAHDQVDPDRGSRVLVRDLPGWSLDVEALAAMSSVTARSAGSPSKTTSWATSVSSVPWIRKG